MIDSAQRRASRHQSRYGKFADHRPDLRSAKLADRSGLEVFSRCHRPTGGERFNQIK
jgi:hypothetical protein